MSQTAQPLDDSDEIVEFDPEEDEEEDEDTTYVYDPDVEYDPARRRRRRGRARARRRTPLRARVRRAVGRVRRIRRPRGLTINALVGGVVALGAFMLSLQQDYMAFLIRTGGQMKNAFKMNSILFTIGGGYGKPEGISDYLGKVFSSPFGLAGLIGTIYGMLPIPRLPWKKWVLTICGAMLIGAIIGSAFHGSNGSTTASAGMTSGSTTEKTSDYPPVRGLYTDEGPESARIAQYYR